MAHGKPCFFAKKISSVIIDTTLIFWASLVSMFFFMSSFFELLSGHHSPISVYLLALIFLIIHFSIRQKFPARFIRKSKHWLTNPERMNEIYTDVILRTFAAVASSVAIFAFLWPEKILFFINDWQSLVEEVAFSFFISFALIIFFVIIIPAAIASLISKALPGFSSKERREYLTLVLYLVFALLFLAHSTVKDLIDQPTILELLTSRALQEKAAVDLIKYLLGIPLFFWLEYLFLGIDWLKARQ
jgi:hypothetical protein